MVTTGSPEVKIPVIMISASPNCVDHDLQIMIGDEGRPESGRLVAGVRLALTTLTVLPVRAGTVDRSAAAVAMAIAPGIGGLLGLAIGGLAVAMIAVGATPLLAAALTIAAGVMLTRGLHLDGLADTVDGLGSHTDAETALAIMRRPDIGPFGVSAIVLVLLTQAAAAAAVLTRPWFAALAGVVAATASGRLAIAAACRRGVPSARSDGLGAVVAGTVGPTALAIGAAAVMVVAAAAVPGRAWQGPVGVIISLATVLIFLRHVVRRLGGVTGDVLGAACELAVTLTYVVLSV